MTPKPRRRVNRAAVAAAVALWAEAERYARVL